LGIGVAVGVEAAAGEIFTASTARSAQRTTGGFMDDSLVAAGESERIAPPYHPFRRPE
jgi:hypothetical protein